MKLKLVSLLLCILCLLSSEANFYQEGSGGFSGGPKISWEELQSKKDTYLPLFPKVVYNKRLVGVEKLCFSEDPESEELKNYIPIHPLGEVISKNPLFIPVITRPQSWSARHNILAWFRATFFKEDLWFYKPYNIPTCGDVQ